jgi:hypothetical protein
VYRFELGYLPGAAADWDGDLLVEYMQGVSWWLHAQEPVGLVPEDLWRSTELLRDQDRRHVGQLRQMSLPPEALLLRRVDGLLFQTAAMTRASAPWGSLMRELVEGGEPVGELGSQHAQWLERRRAA